LYHGQLFLICVVASQILKLSIVMSLGRSWIDLRDHCERIRDMNSKLALGIYGNKNLTPTLSRYCTQSFRFITVEEPMRNSSGCWKTGPQIKKFPSDIYY